MEVAGEGGRERRWLLEGYGGRAGKAVQSVGSESGSEGAAEGPVFPSSGSQSLLCFPDPMAHGDFQDPVSLETGSGSLFPFSFLGT